MWQWLSGTSIRNHPSRCPRKPATSTTVSEYSSWLGTCTLTAVLRRTSLAGSGMQVMVHIQANMKHIIPDISQSIGDHLPTQ